MQVSCQLHSPTALPLVNQAHFFHENALREGQFINKNQQENVRFVTFKTATVRNNTY
jgi:hypothetical protein